MYKGQNVTTTYRLKLNTRHSACSKNTSTVNWRNVGRGDEEVNEHVPLSLFPENNIHPIAS
jgi:hypothetical protein